MASTAAPPTMPVGRRAGPAKSSATPRSRHPSSPDLGSIHDWLVAVR